MIRIFTVNKKRNRSMNTNNYFRNINLRNNGKDKNVEIHYDIPYSEISVSIFGHKKQKNVIKHEHIDIGLSAIEISQVLSHYVHDVKNPYKNITILEPKAKEIVNEGVIQFPRVLINSSYDCQYQARKLKLIYNNDMSRLTKKNRIVMATILDESSQKNINSMATKVNKISQSILTKIAYSNKDALEEFFSTVLRHEAGIHLCELWADANKTIKDKEHLKIATENIIEDMMECYIEIKDKSDKNIPIEDEEVYDDSLDRIEAQRLSIKEIIMKNKHK